MEENNNEENEGNNNGDINGNSDMVDNNVRAGPEVERPERTGSPPPRYPGLQPRYSSTDTDTE